MSIITTDVELGAPRLDGAVSDLDGSSRLREDLLAAAARASKLLLEAPHVMDAMPKVLRELGEAARVDRTAFAITEIDAQGERWLLVTSEWTTEYFIGERSSTVRMAWHERKSDCYCTQLATGRSVYVCHGEGVPRASIASELAKSSVIVPVIVDGEYVAAIGFDDCKQTRDFDPAAVAALEIAASLIAAALHREKLMETMRREREHAAEQHVAELARANALLRANNERLANTPDPYQFLGHMLLDAAHQLDAAAGSVTLLNMAGDEWHLKAFVHDGAMQPPPFQTTLQHSEDLFAGWKVPSREPLYYEVGTMAAPAWPGVYEYLVREGHCSCYKMPMVFGEHIVGFITLAFRRTHPLTSEGIELLVAFGQQLTLAVGLKRLASTAKDTAVLAERNRIGQEIHDGLAQAFTGILMQLGAAEEVVEGSPLAIVLTRIRDIAREGLAEARRSVLAMRSSESRPGGLELALRQLAERSSNGRINSSFEGGGTPTGLMPEHEHALLRIAQEAVSNAIRHAQPSTIKIALTAEAEQLVLSISDDGCGMEHLPELYAQQGFGLTNMRERAQAIGGLWLIDSRPGVGTQVNVRIPRSRRP